MSIKKFAAALAVIAGTVGFASKADAQVIYRSGGYYSSPGVVYGSGYTPGVIYGSGYSPGVVYGSGYGVMPNYNTGIFSGSTTSGYLGGTSLYGNGLLGNSLYGNGLGMYSGANGYNNLYGNAWGTGLNVGTRGATYNGVRLWRR